MRTKEECGLGPTHVNLQEHITIRIRVTNKRLYKLTYLRFLQRTWEVCGLFGGGGRGHVECIRFVTRSEGVLMRWGYIRNWETRVCWA